jgi:thiamine monophosphate kinase
MGEDYELLAALSAADAGRLDFPVVGTCVEGSGVRVRSGGELLDVSGWDHFRTGTAG